jgi:hypothetical protein
MPPRGFLRRSSTATSPEAWLVELRTSGTTDLALITDLRVGGPLAPHVTSAFANSGTWGLLATGQHDPILWGVKWDVSDRTAPDSRIWSLVAGSVPAPGFAPPKVSVADARVGLIAALTESRTFAEGHDELSNWASWFAKSEELLSDPAPQPPYHPDLLPDDAALSRRQLAAAVVQGWVFGGMGSWNDCWLADPAAQSDYERVGADLYSALLAGTASAANGF